jgi:hypothetical protein
MDTAGPCNFDEYTDLLSRFGILPKNLNSLSLAYLNLEKSYQRYKTLLNSLPKKLVTML